MKQISKLDHLNIIRVIEVVALLFFFINGFLTPALAEDLKRVIVTGAGAGGGSGNARVLAFMGNGGSLSPNFLPYGCDFPGEVRVAVGDLTGDGKAEIVTGAGPIMTLPSPFNLPVGVPRVRVFAADGVALATDFLAYPTFPEEGYSPGVFVAVGDVDGDGKAEIITGPDSGSSPLVKVFKADSSLLTQFYAYGIGFQGGVHLAAGDLDGDGKAEIITGAGPGGGPHVRAFKADGTPFPADPDGFGAYNGAFRGGVFVAVADELSPEDPVGSEFIFRVHGQDIKVHNPLLEQVRATFNRQLCTIEATWEAAANGAGGTKDFGIGTVSWDVRQTSVTISDLPRISLAQGADPTTLDFSASIRVDWSTRICAPAGGLLECYYDFTLPLGTTITVSGSMKLAQESAENKEHPQSYYLQVTSISGESRGDGILDFFIDPTISNKVNEVLAQDANGNGIADIKEPFYLDADFPYRDAVFPIYTYLSAGGKFPFSLSTEAGVPVVTTLIGSPIVGDFLPSKKDHPRLLYTTAERSTMKDRKERNFKGWYDLIKSKANTAPTFPVSDFKVPTSCDQVVSEDDWSTREKDNANIALSAALVYDLEGDKTYLYRALEVLFKFADSICDPLFTYQWGQNSLFTAEILTKLSQAYDLLLGNHFPDNLSRDDFLQNRIGLPITAWFAVLPLALPGDQAGSRQFAKDRIEQKFQNLRDVTYLEAHAWDVAGVPNHSMRNAAALGMAALLFNEKPNAYEDISLANSIIWKRLGIASSVPFDNVTNFTKAMEGEGAAEGPHYLNYAAELYLPFLLAYDKFLAGESQPQTFVYDDWAQRYMLQIPNLLISPRVQKVHEWVLKLVLPDGTSPNIKDANRGEAFYSGMLLNATATPDPSLRNLWAWHFVQNNYHVGERLIDIFTSVDETMLQNRQPPNSRYASPTMILQESGNAVFRNSWDSRAIYMHLLGDRTWTSGGIVGGTRIPYHQQEDNGSFLIYAFGDYLALDGGYSSGYEQIHDESSPALKVTKAANHNLVLVDGQGPSKSTETLMTYPLDTLMVDHVQVDTTYQVKVGTTYESVGDKRDVLFLDNRYFVVVDDLIAASSHQYDWMLHGNNASPEKFISDVDGGVWIAPDGQQLRVHVTSSSPQGVEIIPDDNIPHYTKFTSNRDDVSHHTAIAARTNSAGSLRYVATLFPSDGTIPLALTTTFSDGLSFTGIKVQLAGLTDVVIIKNQDYSNSRYTVSGSYMGGKELITDAQVLWLRLRATDKRLVSYFVRDSSYLAYDSVPYLNSLVSVKTSVTGDIDGDGDVDKNDLTILLKDRNKQAQFSTCGIACDLDHDGVITVLDSRILVTLCTRAVCALQ